MEEVTALDMSGWWQQDALHLRLDISRIMKYYCGLDSRNDPTSYRKKAKKKRRVPSMPDHIFYRKLTVSAHADLTSYYERASHTSPAHPPARLLPLRRLSLL